MRHFGMTAAATMLAAVVVFVLLFPEGGHDSDPPECYSVLGYVVPCGFGPEPSSVRHDIQGVGFALAGAVVAATLVSVGSAVGRWERSRD